MSHLRAIKEMYEVSISYHSHMLRLLSQLSKEEYAEMKKTFSYDLSQTFNKHTMAFRIREARDRLYFIEKQYNADGTERDDCDHDIVRDLIDIDPDNSVMVEYCTKCEKTFK